MDNEVRKLGEKLSKQRTELEAKENAIEEKQQEINAKKSGI